MKLADLSQRERARLKNKMMIEQGRLCAYCDNTMTTNPLDHVRFATFDHILPLAEGGPDTLENLTLACKPCNTAKGQRTPDELREIADRIDMLVEAMHQPKAKGAVG